MQAALLCNFKTVSLNPESENYYPLHQPREAKMNMAQLQVDGGYHSQIHIGRH